MKVVDSHYEFVNNLRTKASGAPENSWEIGLLDPDQWSAKWVEPSENSGGYSRQRPAYWVAGHFTVGAAIESAVLHSTARGFYEAFLNGARVGDIELAPGISAYRRRLQVHTYDVTPLIRQGDNFLASLLSDGPWRGQNGYSRRVNEYGATTSFFAQLEVTMVDGQSFVVGTDESWRSQASHIVRVDPIAGEVHDLRRQIEWNEMTPHLLSEWSPVGLGKEGFDQMCLPVGPPIRRIEELPAKQVTRLRPGSWVVDFGQNSNGWVRLSNLGDEGRETILTYGEAVDDNGDVIQQNVAHTWLGVPEAATVTFQVDKVIASGREGEFFEPRHSTKGFQFVRIDGTDEFKDTDVVSVVVHSDVTKIGEFECSDDGINQLHLIADWSFRGNICDVPSDCPTRERAGWTGDWQVYLETAAYLYDVTGFSTKWLRDLSADQRAWGAVPHFIPDPHPLDDHTWNERQGACGWGDAAIHVPWQLYLSTGESSVLAEQWVSMLSWHEYCANAAATKRHPSRVARSATPLAHEKYLWDTGFHFGEWLEPGVELKAASDRARTEVDHGLVATAYLYRSAYELAQIAGVLGKEEDAARLHAYAESVKEAWQAEFVNDDGEIESATQANLTRALAFGLLPDEMRPHVSKSLVDLISGAGVHLGTGVLTTGFLLPVLSDNGYLDLAYELLFKRDIPSWLVMVDRGATTVWEEWEGVDEYGGIHASLNHYAKGAVVSFLHRYVAGLQHIDPGYRSFAVHPRLGGGLTFARTYHDCPYGRIEVAWTVSGDSFDIEITVPKGTTGHLEMPGGGVEILTPGRHHRHGPAS